MNDEAHKKAIQNVIYAIGQSVILYQQIENQLKVLLPHISKPNSKVTKDPYAEMEKLINSRETMGPLFERLKESVQITHPEGFGKYLEQVANNRNELIHKFIKLPVSNMNSVKSCQIAFEYVQEKKAFALPLANLLEVLLKEFVDYLDNYDGFQDEI